MKKALIIAIITLLILVVGISGYSMWKNKVSVNSYTLEYKTPDDFGPWEKTELQNGMQLYQNPDDKAVIMFVLPVPTTNNFEIDNWEGAIKKDKEQCKKLEVIKIEKFKTNGYEASEYISECEKDSNIYKMRNISIVNYNNEFQFGLSAPRDTFDKNNIIFEDIINSVNWQ